MLIEALCPLLVRLPGGDLCLEPGIPVDLPEEHASRLLAKVPDKVRRVELIPPEINQVVQWQSVDGTVRSGLVDFVHLDETGTYWVFLTMSDGRWTAVSLRHMKGLA